MQEEILPLGQEEQGEKGKLKFRSMDEGPMNTVGSHRPSDL